MTRFTGEAIIHKFLGVKPQGEEGAEYYEVGAISAPQDAGRTNARLWVLHGTIGDALGVEFEGDILVAPETLVRLGDVISATTLETKRTAAAAAAVGVA